MGHWLHWVSKTDSAKCKLTDLENCGAMFIQSTLAQLHLSDSCPLNLNKYPKRNHISLLFKDLFFLHNTLLMTY